MAFSRFSGDQYEGAPAAGRVAMIDTLSWRLAENYPQQGEAWPVFSQDGLWMAIVGYGRRLQIIDRAKNRMLLNVHQNDMIDAVFDTVSRQIYIVRTDGVIEVRAAPEWQIVRKLSYPLQDDQRSIGLGVTISKDGRQLLIKADGRSFLIFTDNNAHVILEHDVGSFTLGALSPSGNYVVTASWGCEYQCAELIVWDSQSGKRKGTYPHDKRVTAIAISHDSQQIISATNNW